MVFNSLVFIVFLAALLVLDRALRSWSVRKQVLLAASYIFYGAWNPPFLLLLWLSTLVDWFASLWLAKLKDGPRRTGLMLISVAVNLGLLGFFKYATFITESIGFVGGFFGLELRLPLSEIVLPVGISFYTFQTLSYTLDVYLRRAQPAASFLDFALYVTFFPQLVAGPIVRATDFLPQCEAPRRATPGMIGYGLFLLSLGLFEKVVLADVCFAPAADTVFGAQGPVHSLDSWIGLLAFSGQIFCDFAGYSTCAIGAALCFGFHLIDNFRFPYAAIGFSDFWRRWHISLSTWLRDYLYIPLGGNRSGRTSVNLMVTMLLGGLWHGAAWTFVAWGALHGILLVAERALRRSARFVRAVESVPGAFLLGLFTYFMVNMSWVFFRSKSFAAAGGMFASLFLVSAPGAKVLPTLEIAKVTVALAGLLACHALMRDRKLESVIARTPAPLLVLAWTSMLLLVILAQGGGNAFIYFQF